MSSYVWTCTTKVPCVYLLRLGYVESLRKQLTIPSNFRDDCIVLKYGRTVDLRRRAAEHRRFYKTRLQHTPDLQYHTLVLPQLLVDAERDIEQWFKNKDLYLENKEHTEIAIATRSTLRSTIKKEYERIGLEYGVFDI